MIGYHRGFGALLLMLYRRLELNGTWVVFGVSPKRIVTAVVGFVFGSTCRGRHYRHEQVGLNTAVAAWVGMNQVEIS